MKYIKSLILAIITLFPPITLSQLNNDFWRINTDTYIEIEEYQGQRDAFKNKVFDKVSMIGELNLRNPESNWRFALEHRESLRNYGRNFSMSRGSYIRNRTQFGSTYQLVQNEASQLSLNFTYRKESNDSAPNTLAHYSHSLYWLMPAASYQFNEKWSLDFWTAFYYYSNYHRSNNHEWEAQYSIVYQYAPKIKGILSLYHDRVWASGFTNTFSQDQIRGELPITINQNWRIFPYFRYYLSEHAYNSAQVLTQKIKKGYRLGAKIEYNITPKLILWSGFAIEPTNWQYAKYNKITSGNNNKQTYYLSQLGVQYQWQ